MQIGDRIRLVRKENGMTQIDFAKSLRIGSGSVSRIESGENNPSPRTIELICREFHVREEWLRTGEGPMMEEKSREEQISALIRDALSSEPESFKASLIAALCKLPPPDWAVLERFFDSVYADWQGTPQPETRTVHDWTPDEMAEEARRQGEAEEADRKKGGKTSSTSGPGKSGTECG